MTRTTIHEDEQDVTVEGVDYCVGFRLVTEHSAERYGADADGNRGVLRDYREPHATLTKVERYDDAGMIELPLGEIPAPLQHAILAKLEEVERAVEAEWPYRDDDEADAAYDEACDRRRDEDRDP
jgi:hypothetical protein